MNTNRGKRLPDKGNKRGSFANKHLTRGKRQEAMAEIEGWIQDSKGDFGRGAATRASGQPAKNVTEQKMLDSKLFEMSRQRYNFILHSEWQRKLFMKNQLQKTAVMKDLMKNVDLEHIQANSVRNRNRRRNMVYRRKPVTAGEYAARDEELEITSVPNREKTVTFITERRNRASDDHTDPASENYIQLPHIEVKSRGMGRGHFGPFRQDNADFDERWPTRDSRFTRVLQALSENHRILPSLIQHKMPLVNTGLVFA